ncbi:MAG: hypothetical protein LQ341_007294, partial [Variospora aurantia]
TGEYAREVHEEDKIPVNLATRLEERGWIVIDARNMHPVKTCDVPRKVLVKRFLHFLRRFDPVGKVDDQASQFGKIPAELPIWCVRVGTADVVRPGIIIHRTE